MIGNRCYDGRVEGFLKGVEIELGLWMGHRGDGGAVSAAVRGRGKSGMDEFSTLFHVVPNDS